MTSSFPPVLSRRFARHPLALAVLSLVSGLATAQTPPAAATAVAPADTVTAPQPAGTLSEVQVTSERLRKARVELSPKVGTTVYSIDQPLIESLGKGDAAAFDEVLLSLPGVSKDSKGSGSLHVRNDHGNVQYRINGIQLPEGISGFGQSLDTRYVNSIDFLTGALPAQYGLRTAGVVDIQTKEGLGKPGGSVGVTMGSHRSLEGNASVYGTTGNLSYYLSATGLRNDIGIENPQPGRNPLNDRTRQGRTFGNFSYYLDDNTRLGLMFGSYDGRFNIPTNPNQVPSFSLTGFSNTATGYNGLPSSAIRERQNETSRFVAGALQKTIDKLDFQLSVFHQYSQLHYLPDPVGDLIYNGVASESKRSATANGLQFDASYKLVPAHTLRFGGGYTRTRTRSLNSVNVFPVDGDGEQIGSSPVLVTDNSAKTGQLGSLYLQDEWKIDPRFTVNYGIRYDSVNAFTREHQFSPRINALYQLTPATAVHAGFARYFTPPPQELASQQSINLYNGTSNQAEVATSSAVRAERTSYYDIGASHKLTDKLTLSADAYYKQVHNLLDEGQFGQALILSPFNYARGKAKGLELSARYNDANWLAYLNAAWQRAEGRNIVSSQSLFGADELAYIARNYVHLDHDQQVTLSGGASYKFGNNRVSSDFVYGSGMRNTVAGGTPNGASLPSYLVVNASYSHTWKSSGSGDVVGRISVLNLFDRSYLLRDGTGIGVGAPQYGLRRSIYASLTKHF